ncbi:MAG: HD domain-containing phosphohydrolase [Amphritea sp.]
MTSIRMRGIEKVLSYKDLRVGETLPYPIYSLNGSLLLSKETVLASAHQIERILSNYGRCYISRPQSFENKKARKRNRPVTTFMIVQSLLDRMKEAFHLIHDDKDTSFARRIQQLVIDIQAVCDKNSEGIIGTIQLMYDAPHGLVHPLHAAILCEVVCRKMGKKPQDRSPIVAAALTHDIGMFEIQQELFEQSTPITPTQQHMIKAHPQRGYDQLRRKGITEVRWLDPVLHHHERLDGSGYPDGIKGDQLTHNARLLSIADCYSAMTRPRAYRSRVLPKEAIREIFQERGKTIGDELARLFINALGIYSPGSLVKLENGVKAIVTGQTRNLSEPKLTLLTDKSGAPFSPSKRIRSEHSDDKIVGLLCPVKHRQLIENLSTIWPMMNPISDI